MPEGRFVLVYHEDLIANYPTVWDSDKLLSTWLRLFSLADKMWPSPADLPRGVSASAVKGLTDAGLLIPVPRHRFTVRGLDAMRQKKSAAAQTAANKRWDDAKGNAAGNATGNAPMMPTKPDVDQTQTNTAPKPPPTPEAKPKPKGPNEEPRLTQRQLDSWDNFRNPSWQPFMKSWLGRGLLYAPFGSPDDNDTSQRGLLWQIADARPNDLGRWVKEAPGKTAREVITYVLEQWHDVRASSGVDDDEWEEMKREDRRTASGAMTRVGETVAGLR